MAKKRKIINTKCMKILTLVTIAISLCFNFVVFLGNANTSLTNVKEISDLVNTNKINGRLKYFHAKFDVTNIDNYLNLNTPTTYYFSSLIDGNTIEANKLLFNGSSKVSASGGGENLISESLMGQKYYLSSGEQNRPYLKLIDKSENCYLYENLLATSGTILVDESFSFSKDKSIYENFELLKESFGVSGNLFEDIDLEIEQVTEFDTYYAHSLSKVTFNASQTGILYINSNILYSQSNDYFKEKFNTQNVIQISDFSENIHGDLFFINAGETVEYYIFSCSDKNQTLEAEYKFLNYEVAEELCNKFKENQAEYTTLSNGYEAKINSNSTNKLIIFTPYINGLNFKLNGETIEMNNECGFASVVINEGENHIVADFTPKYLKIWIVAGLVLILVAIIFGILYHYTKFKHIQKVIYFFFICLNCCFLSIFYLIGLILSFCVIVL